MVEPATTVAEASHALVARVFMRVQARVVAAEKIRRQRNVRARVRQNCRRKRQRRRAAIVAGLPAARLRLQLEQQHAVVRCVLQAEEKGDWLAVLGLGPGSGTAVDANDLGRAFRARAIAVHPDKNKAPGAASAFDAVHRAREHVKVYASAGAAVGPATTASKSATSRSAAAAAAAATAAATGVVGEWVEEARARAAGSRLRLFTATAAAAALAPGSGVGANAATALAATAGAGIVVQEVQARAQCTWG